MLHRPYPILLLAVISWQWRFVWAQCPSGFTRLGSYFVCYQINQNFLTWNLAQTACQALGANLITIISAGEMSAVNTLMASIGTTQYHIGLNDKVTEGTFRWSDGHPVVYANWNSGEPNNINNNEDCVLVLSDGLWNDVNCADTSVNSKSVCAVRIATPSPTAAPSAMPSVHPTHVPSAEPSVSP
eukprot:gene16912-12103_t